MANVTAHRPRWRAALFALLLALGVLAAVRTQQSPATPRSGPSSASSHGSPTPRGSGAPPPGRPTASPTGADPTAVLKCALTSGDPAQLAAVIALSPGDSIDPVTAPQPSALRVRLDDSTFRTFRTTDATDATDATSATSATMTAASPGVV